MHFIYVYTKKVLGSNYNYCYISELNISSFRVFLSLIMCQQQIIIHIVIIYKYIHTLFITRTTFSQYAILLVITYLLTESINI